MLIASRIPPSRVVEFGVILFHCYGICILFDMYIVLGATWSDVWLSWIPFRASLGLLGDLEGSWSGLGSSWDDLVELCCRKLMFEKNQDGI